MKSENNFITLVPKIEGIYDSLRFMDLLISEGIEFRPDTENPDKFIISMEEYKKNLKWVNKVEGLVVEYCTITLSWDQKL